MKDTRAIGRLPPFPSIGGNRKIHGVLLLACLVPARAALAQTPETVPAMPVPDQSQALAAALAEMQQREGVERAALRAEFTQQLAAERAAREASEQRAAAEVQKRVDEGLAANPSVVGVKGLSVTGFVQADLAFRQSSEDQINSSTGAPLNEDRFVLRRARVATAYDSRFWASVFELDANTVSGGQVRIINAEASARWPGSQPQQPPLLMATFGLFKIPFGWEVVERDRDRLFLERSTVVRALFPGEYDLGGRLQGGWRFLRYAVAVQNGEPIGERTFPLRDPNLAKDVTGRVGVDTPIGALAKLAAGFSALYGRGFHKGTPATKPTLSWQDRNENGTFDSGELQVAPGVSATPSANFSRFALGADARLSWRIPQLGETVVYGELIWAKNLDRAVLIADPLGPLGRDLREFGYYVAAVQDLGPYVQVGVRYDSYDPDRDATDTQGGRLVPSSQVYQTVALALALRSGPARLVFEYDINRNHLGRASNGMPANLADNAFTIRSEVKF
jgi:hypothetical protein